MHLVVHKEDLTRALAATTKVVEARSTIPILSSVQVAAAGEGLAITATDLDIVATAGVPAEVSKPGNICVSAKLLNDIARKATGDITMTLDGDKLLVKSGRSRFSLATLSADDFPTLGNEKFDAEFEIDLAALFAPVSFAISTEETRYYLNGVFFRGGKSEAVATDGHRLGRHIGPDLPAFEGIIVPRKTVGLLPKGKVQVAVSQQKIRIVSDDVRITSKLIDGTFPDYERVIPKSNKRVVTVDRDALMKASDRVSTVSSERGRAVKFSIAPGSIALAVAAGEASANDEVEAEYSGEPMDIGFNAAYVRDVLSVLPSGPVKLALQDGGTPGLITSDGFEGLTLVCMPMRV
ncbi:DNA polymerase-3 subunit beta [Agrobacterium sp. RC10-4-1]|uniref:DNA polymerase III subunit beta n=1 Tax=Agrobacterium sp. RC10-4-1 TaxID=2587039 RepID=UPI0015FD81D6|nr:DNA polymerase III subunit beta [Agrobacterium sp. RC10-4-1]MBA8797893.1 DNA polymerase-3 subunit beta [Agrobacterium sp. RC10-4-1]